MAVTIVRTATSSQIGSLLTQSSASTTYLTQTSASSTYLTQSSASNTYLTQASASTIYAPITPLTQTGFRNIITNGGFSIDQRGFGTGRTIVAGDTIANGYTVDRWYNYCTGANVTTARIAGSGSNQYSYRFTGATSNTLVGFGQRIETANSFHFAGQTANLSVSLASSSLTSVTWTAFYANTTDTFGTLASPTRTQIATGTFTINSILTRYNTNISIPAAATTGIEIVFTTGALLSAQTLTFAAIQLELGSFATPFERRPVGTELSLCQRYYQNIVTPNSTTDFNGLMVRESATQAQASVYLPVSMRITPALIGSYLGRSVFRDTSFNVAAGANSAISVSSSGPNSNWITLVITHASVAGTYVYAEWDLLNTTTNLGLNAEL